MPHSTSRRAIQSGRAGRRVEPGDRAQHQAVGGGRVDDDARVPGAVDGRAARASAGSWNATSYAVAASRAMPRIDSAYDRSGVTAMSSTSSRRPSSVDRVGAELGVAHQVGRQHQDAVVVVAGAELAGRADHAVADVSVGLAGGDREAARQRGAGQRDDHEVADGEVERTADDAARLAPRRRRPCTSGRSCRWSAVSSSNDSTRPSTTGPSMSWPGRSTVSTSRPAATSRSARSRPVTSAGRSAYSRSQDSGARIRSPSRTGGRSARRPRPCRACPRRRAGTSGCARCPCRTRSRCSGPGRCRRRPAPAG